MLVLSIFPGIDLLGRGFEAEGYCVVRGPDVLWGGDIRSFTPPPGHFEGIIGGSPCQDFSRLRRTPPTGEGLELLGEFVRCVEAAQPAWFVLENVPGVPDIRPEGYTVQRLDLRANECGLSQQRLRHFQFGSRDGRVLVLARRDRAAVTERCAVASEGKQAGRRDWPAFCAAQGLPALDLGALTVSAQYRVVGNGVPVPMAQTIARAVRGAVQAGSVRVCICGCGRTLSGLQQAATAACRKRLERRRRVTSSVNEPGQVTPAQSQKGTQ